MEGGDFYQGPSWLTVIDKGVFAQWFPFFIFASVNKPVGYGELTLSPTSTMPRSIKIRYIPCPVKSCTRQFTNQGGLKNHIRMHCTPKANPNLQPHQPPMDDNNVLDGDFFWGDNDIPVEHQDHPRNPEKPAKEKVAYHPLINGKLSHFHSKE